MPRSRIVQNSFTSGELDPLLHERYDHVLYSAGLSLFQNWILKPHGAVTRRPGMRRVADAKNSTAERFIGFIFNVAQGVMLELGHLYIRFFADNGQLLSGGLPLEIVSPYTSAQIADIQYTQSGDIMVLTHPEVAPYELARLGATTWRLREIEFIPPPTSESGFSPGDILTLSAVTGNITMTAATAVFFASDDNRVISEIPTLGNGQAVITTVTSSTVVSATVINDFVSTSIAQGSWKLSGSPVAALAISTANPTGAITTLTLQRHFTLGNSNKVTNGTFTTLANWTDNSGGIVTSGSGDAGGSDLLLYDAAGTFLTSGVRIGHRALNTTSGTEDEVLGVRSNVLLDVSANGAAHGAGLNYSIQKTGTATALSPGCTLDGGRQGMAWIYQSITVVNDVTYRVLFDVSNQPISFMVSTVAGRGDLKEEFSYIVGNKHEVVFTAVGTSAILEFRNNQSQIGTVNNVEVREYDINGFRAVDVGKYIKVNGGVVEIIERINETQVKGVIRHQLADTITAPRGSWSLETPMWSAANGYPKSACFFGSHLYFAGTTTFPTRVWANRLLSLYNFSEGTEDDAAFQFQIAATEINASEWLIGERVLLVGTQREEFTVRGSVGQTITPTSIEPSSPSKFGSANIQPVRAQRAVLFVQRGRKRIRELTFDDVAEDRKNSDRSLQSEHLTATDPIKKIVYQQEPTSILWALTDSGELLGMSYLLDQLVFGWCRYPTTGTIVDIGVIPHSDGDRDQLWLLIKRFGQTMVEYIDDASGFYGQLMVDSGVVGSFSPATTSISGLTHLAGRTVTILTDGYPHPSLTVSSTGTLTLNWAASTVEVGLPFTPKLTTLRPAFGGSVTQKSIALTGLKLSNVRTTVGLVDTINMLVNDQRVAFTSNVDPMDTAPPLFTGIKEIELTGWDQEIAMTIEQDQPYPITVTGIMRTIEIEEP